MPPAVNPSTAAPQGTFLPNTKVQVGSHRVIIEKYLSEGGFAHVYIVRVPRENSKHEIAVLKRVAVPDRDHLASMRTEVETMKKLNGHKHVVTYMDSHASQLKGGGYEVFLLMEYCSGGGLIDFMNTRLQHRLTEPEILKIFGDVAEGVACMHYLKPPLLHRDLKVENVLISKSSSSGAPMYKLCDFGSTAPPRPAAKTADEGRLIEEDVQKHTTMQYRSPEMIDVWRKQPIDEKADIWALGVLLYKLCYYTTPFEDVGQMAILNASFKYPSYPSFSDKLKKLIARMLKEDPRERPNIYQVIKEVCGMRGTDVPIKDIYTNRTHSEARRNESLPSPEPPMPSNRIGLQKEAPQIQVQSIPDIAPMRRGRPTAPAQQAPTPAKPSPSPARGDPFAALDSKNYDVRSGAVDELSKRFPSLDEFSITHEKGGAFPFSQQSPRQSADPSQAKLSERVTNALADEVFNQSTLSSDVAKSKGTGQSLQQVKTAPPKPSDGNTRAKETLKIVPIVHQPTPVRPSVTYTSTGVGASPPTATKPEFPALNKRPIWKVPDHHRSSSQPRASDAAQDAAASLQPGLPPGQRTGLLDIYRSKSQSAAPNSAISPTSSRPSLEGRRTSQLELGESSITRAKSAQSRQRPSSVYVSSNLDYLRDQESARKRPSMEGKRHSRQSSQEFNMPADDVRIDTDRDFLRNSEDGLPNRKSSKGGSGHKKRSSLANAKSVLSGRFGDAFKRFEPSTNEIAVADPVPVLSGPRVEKDEPRLLSPIQGSQYTGASDKHSDLDSSLAETEDLPPDVRRELERRRLSQEEKRVAQAAAEYRARVAKQGPGGNAPPSRADTIQKRVQSLLDEGRQSPVSPKRTAEGYGRYTDNPDLPQDPPPPISKAAPPPTARKPMATPELTGGQFPKTRLKPLDTSVTNPYPSASAAVSQPAQAQPRVASRPSVPPKSQALRTGASSKSQWPPQADRSAEPKSAGGLAALLAKDLEGVPDYPPRGSSTTETAGRLNNGAVHLAEEIDPEADFSERYPSLSSIEMVETEIRGTKGGLNFREV